MMQRMKEQIKPEFMDKVKMTEAQADKVIEVNFESQQQMCGLHDLNEFKRKSKWMIYKMLSIKSIKTFL
jgi:hypothetical protein